MAEPLNLMLKARELIATSSHQGLEILLNQLSSRPETIEFQSASALYNFCAAKFPCCLFQMLLKLDQSSSNCVVRFQSIYLLSEFSNRGFELPLVALNDIKPLVISCLMMKETKESDMKILRRLVSFVAYDVVRLDNGGWNELGDCILSLAITEPKKAFHVFIDLPPFYGEFIYTFMQEIVEKAEIVLMNPELDRVEDWSLGLETLVKMGIQLLDSERRLDLVKNLLTILVKSANELFAKGMEQFLLRGLENLERFLSRDKIQYGFNKDQCLFVSSFMFKIRELGTPIKEVARKINRLVKSCHNPNHGAGFDGDWFDHLNKLSSLEILRIFASTDLEEKCRDMAIRRLNLLLSDHTSKKVEIDVSVMRQLQPLLITCLSKEGISESMFKILGEVVYHVAYEMMNVQDEKWFGLRDYIVS
ncbi:unnamed protein product [Arabis nemorensis]|uniref:DUF577 domain-containing protein n=1 Tax=Arabis nemorensis TaxID=586526 RepID=A0A565CNM2_9BRAS|nr:unnamed protein product [Arabis nemorensis]